MSKAIACNETEIFPACRRVLDGRQWQEFLALLSPAAADLAVLAGLLAGPALALPGAPPYLSDLARLELALYRTRQESSALPAAVERLTVNPSLQLLESAWAGLPGLLGEEGAEAGTVPFPQQELILVWFDPATANSRARTAGDEELLVLKLVSEGIEPRQAAALGELPVGAIFAALQRAADKGLLLAPPSRLRREEALPLTGPVEPRFLAAELFTLQWHITQACDLHCKHCYDRSARAPVSLAQGLAVLDELLAFCQSRHVRGQVSFSGGNPLLHPHFLSLYQAAVDRGFLVAILGNATSRERLLPVLAIEKPAFYQVSLEGLPEHNDFIRGKGYFARVMEFLELLREEGVYSMVMLTLTRGNQAQVLPLAELLRGRADRFVFNRLAMVGEGSLLESAPIAEYREFLERYLAAAQENPGLGLKDNLFNLLRAEKGEPLLGGCAGFGCGAAFNFVSLLPDGEVHACRKFPSPIGDLFRQPLAEIYDSPAARQYRAGSRACRECRLRPACGGCLAVSHGFGLDVFSERDPYCFLEQD